MDDSLLSVKEYEAWYDQQNRPSGFLKPTSDLVNHFIAHLKTIGCDPVPLVILRCFFEWKDNWAHRREYLELSYSLNEYFVAQKNRLAFEIFQKDHDQAREVLIAFSSMMQTYPENGQFHYHLPLNHFFCESQLKAAQDLVKKIGKKIIRPAFSAFSGSRTFLLASYLQIQILLEDLSNFELAYCAFQSFISQIEQVYGIETVVRPIATKFRIKLKNAPSEFKSAFKPVTDLTECTNLYRVLQAFAKRLHPQSKITDVLPVGEQMDCLSSPLKKSLKSIEEDFKSMFVPDSVEMRKDDVWTVPPYLDTAVQNNVQFSPTTSFSYPELRRYVESSNWTLGFWLLNKGPEKCCHGHPFLHGLHKWLESIYEPIESARQSIIEAKTKEEAKARFEAVQNHLQYVHALRTYYDRSDIENIKHLEAEIARVTGEYHVYVRLPQDYCRLFYANAVPSIFLDSFEDYKWELLNAMMAILDDAYKLPELKKKKSLA